MKVNNMKYKSSTSLLFQEVLTLYLRGRGRVSDGETELPLDKAHM